MSGLSIHSYADCGADQYFQPEDQLRESPLKRPHPEFSKSLRLARSGNAIEQSNLGFYYSEGYMVSPCKEKAAYWYEKAAVNGSDIAKNWIKQYTLFEHLHNSRECAGSACDAILASTPIASTGLNSSRTTAHVDTSSKSLALARSPPVSNSIAAETSSISVRGKTFRMGDTADDVFATLKPTDSKKTDTGPDPSNPRSVLVTHHYEIEGKSFSLTFARTSDPGPYRLIRISAPSLQKTVPTASAIANKKSEEASPNSANSSVVDCINLSSYAKAKGHSWMERVAIVDSARRAGNCK